MEIALEETLDALACYIEDLYTGFDPLAGNSKEVYYDNQNNFYQFRSYSRMVLDDPLLLDTPSIEYLTYLELLGVKT